ncbi:MAG: thioredoxin family protein [Fusobacterium sp.]|nr:thioredoxin family protein [Fusobacterium sp.]
MEFKELFETGMNYDIFMNIASKEEREQIKEITSVLRIGDSFARKIKNIDKKFHFLLSAEAWCPYVRATVPVLMKMLELNPNISMSIITEGRGFKYLREKLDIPEAKYVVPTLAILDENFNLVNKYIGRPFKYRAIGFENVSNEYFKGQRADDIVEEIIEKMGY